MGLNPWLCVARCRRKTLPHARGVEPVGVVTAAQVQRTFHMPLFAAHGKRVAISAEMLGGLLAYPIVRKVFAAMASKSFSSNLLPAVLIWLNT